MRRINKSKVGFTLVELVLVIAIILILASVAALSVSDILKKGQDAQGSISDEVSIAKGKIQAEEDDLKKKGF